MYPGHLTGDAVPDARTHGVGSGGLIDLLPQVIEEVFRDAVAVDDVFGETEQVPVGVEGAGHVEVGGIVGGHADGPGVLVPCHEEFQDVCGVREIAVPGVLRFEGSGCYDGGAEGVALLVHVVEAVPAVVACFLVPGVANGVDAFHVVVQEFHPGAAVHGHWAPEGECSVDLAVLQPGQGQLVRVVVPGVHGPAAGVEVVLVGYAHDGLAVGPQQRDRGRAQAGPSPVGGAGAGEGAGEVRGVWNWLVGKEQLSGKMLFDEMIEHADGMLAAMKLERGDDLILEALRFTGSDRMLSGGVVEGEVRRE